LNLIFVGLLIAGYFAGSIPLGVIVCRARGIDIFSVGSGNVGATNVSRALGARWGAAVFVGDVLKAFIPAMAARYILPGHQSEWAAVGVAAVAGHILSPFLGFRGGKGVSCALGMALAVSPLTAICGLGIFMFVFLLTRYVSLGSLIAVPAAAGFSWLYGDQRPVIALFGTMGALTIVLHRKNINRLIAGTEPRFGFKSSSDAPRDPEVLSKVDQAEPEDEPLPK
jgi:glycerol-3-phosphate acyltransferase PlsY